jgi:hypothetical protein
MVGDGTPHRLGARDTFATAQIVERLDLLPGQFDDGPHYVIISRHQMSRDPIFTPTAAGFDPTCANQVTRAATQSNSIR